MELQISKWKGIDELVSDYSPQKVEEEQSLRTEGSMKFQELLDKYESMPPSIPLMVKAARELPDILSPEQLQAFLNVTSLKKVLGGFSGGVFLTQLLYNSYAAGHRRFILPVENEISGLFSYKNKQKMEEPYSIVFRGDLPEGCATRAYNLHLDVQGTVGTRFAHYAKRSTFRIPAYAGIDCGYAARNCEFHIAGVAENCGYKCNNATFDIGGCTSHRCGAYAKNSTFHIEGSVAGECGCSAESSSFDIIGDTGNDCGSKSLKSKFNVIGSVGNFCGSEARFSEFAIGEDVGYYCGDTARYCVITLHGKVGNNCGRKAEDTTFKTSNRNTLERLLLSVAARTGKFTSRNKIVFIEDGKEEVVRDYAK